MASNETGHVAVLWMGVPQGEPGLELQVSRDFGETWLPEAIRIDDTTNTEVGWVSMDEAGRVYCLWNESFPEPMAYFRAVYPTLGITLSPLADDDGILIVPPEGGRIRVEIDLRNHHPTDGLSGLVGYLEGELRNGSRTGPVTQPRMFGIPFGGSRTAVLSKRFPGAMAPGLYHLVVTIEGAIEDSVRVPIIKR